MRALGITHRTRIWDPITTLWASIAQAISADRSYREAVARLRACRAVQGLPDCSGNTAAYTQAKKRQSEDLIIRLAKKVASKLEASIATDHLWHGHHVKIVDGTCVTMADTFVNQCRYPRSKSTKPGIGFPISRGVGLFSAYSGALLNFSNAAYEGKGTGESTLFRSMHSSVNPGDIVLADRYYDGFFLVAYMMKRNAHLVVRSKDMRSIDFSRGEILGEEDHIIYRSKPRKPKWMSDEEYQSLPEVLRIRELRVPLYKDKKLLLQTTLLDKKYPKDDLVQLYRDRWDCELDIRDLKITLQLDHLRCKDPKMVYKEIWLGILAHNLLRSLVTESANKHDLRPRGLSFKGTVQLVTQFAPHLSTLSGNETGMYNLMLKAISEEIVRNRAGRVEPRKKKRRPKGERLMEPRGVARERILKERGLT